MDGNTEPHDESAATLKGLSDLRARSTSDLKGPVQPLLAWSGLSFVAAAVVWLTEKDRTVIVKFHRRFVFDRPATNTVALSTYWIIATVLGVAITLYFHRRRRVIPRRPDESKSTNPAVGFLIGLVAATYGLGILIGFERGLARNGVVLMLPVAIGIVMLGRLLRDRELERVAAWSLVPMAASAGIAGARGALAASIIYGAALLIGTVISHRSPAS